MKSPNNVISRAIVSTKQPRLVQVFAIWGVTIFCGAK